MKRIATVSALACALAFASAAVAQQSPTQNFAYGDYRSTTTGTVDSFRAVNLQGLPDDHVIVRVQPQEARRGEFEFVNLGSRDELRNRGIRIYSDQRITAEGQTGQIDGRPVLFAESITLDGERFALGQVTPSGERAADRSRDYQWSSEYDRDRQYRDRDYDREYEARDYERRQQARQYDEVWPYDESREFERSGDTRFRDTGDTHMIRGEVDSFREFRIDGVRERHRLMKITDVTRADQPSYIVDLGPASGPLAELDLKEGDRVMVQGHTARIEGRPVLQATQVAEVYAQDEGFASESRLYSSRLRRDSPEPADSMSQRVGKPQKHDLPSRTSSDERNQ